MKVYDTETGKRMCPLKVAERAIRLSQLVTLIGGIALVIVVLFTSFFRSCSVGAGEIRYVEATVTDKGIKRISNSDVYLVYTKTDEGVEVFQITDSCDKFSFAAHPASVDIQALYGTNGAVNSNTGYKVYSVRYAGGFVAYNWMGGTIRDVADYRNHLGAIGYTFRYRAKRSAADRKRVTVRVLPRSSSISKRPGPSMRPETATRIGCTHGPMPLP